MSRVHRTLNISSCQRFAQRFYAAYKTPNYYDVLGVDSKASKKDIREAFLTLSKQMHPDKTKKDGHTDFVKITEAYNVLSKDESRREYDAKLENPRSHYYTHGYYSRPYRTSYYYRDSRFEEWNENLRNSRPPKYTSHNFYEGFGGEKFKPISKATIVLVCLVISGMGYGLQMLAISMSPVFDRSKLLRDSERYAMEHRKVRDNALKYTNEENIEQFRRKSASEFVEE